MAHVQSCRTFFTANNAEILAQIFIFASVDLKSAHNWIIS